MPSQKPFSKKGYKPKNRGRTSLRSAVAPKTNDDTQAEPAIVKAKSSSASSVKKTSKRPKKYAAATKNASTGEVRLSYNALLDVFGSKKKVESKPIEEYSEDDDYGNGSENEDLMQDDDDDAEEDFKGFVDEEKNVQGEEYLDKPEGEDEPGLDNYDSSDERNQLEGFNEPEDNVGSDDEEKEEVNEDVEEKNIDPSNEDDIYFKHFQSVDSSVFESLPPPPTVISSAKPTISLTPSAANAAAAAASAAGSLEWSSKPYTAIPQSSFKHKSLLYTLDEENAQLPVLKPGSTSISDFVVRPKLKDPWARENPTLSQTQKDLINPLFNYRDILYSLLTVQNHEDIRKLYCLHILNHIYKAQRTIYNNDLQLRLPGAAADLEFHDQGFTKTKVLLILPTKDACYKVLSQLALLSNLEELANKKRFKDAFYFNQKPPSSRPDDFIELFSGNSDDMFCLGIKITMKSMKFYANFYDADIIVASPLGLDMIIGKEGGEKKPEFDFLSSVELVVVDQADAMYMQNWEHVQNIFNKLNVTPREAHGCDFSRLKPWITEEKSAYFRQSVILSQYLSPEMNSLFSNSCFNLAGKLKVRPVYEGSMANIGGGNIRIRQTFSRLVPPRSARDEYENDPSKDPDLRFTYFTTVILPSILRGAAQEGTLIYIPSYMDFTRIRNYLDSKNDISFSVISEYTSIPEVTRTRDYFNTGRSKILLYTERFHHFRRYDIKGALTVIYYGLPENPIFYEEVTRNLVRTVAGRKLDPEMVKVRAIYSQWDAFKLERIVGTKRVGIMLRGTSETYEFK